MGPLCPEQLTQEETLEEVCVGPFADGGERIRALSRIQRMRMQLWICGKTEFDRQGRSPAGIDLPPQDQVPQALGL
jgi:hypothetical protein